MWFGTCYKNKHPQVRFCSSNFQVRNQLHMRFPNPQLPIELTEAVQAHTNIEQVMSRFMDRRDNVYDMANTLSMMEAMEMLEARQHPAVAASLELQKRRQYQQTQQTAANNWSGGWPDWQGSQGSDSWQQHWQERGGWTDWQGSGDSGGDGGGDGWKWKDWQQSRSRSRNRSSQKKRSRDRRRRRRSSSDSSDRRRSTVLDVHFRACVLLTFSIPLVIP